MSKFTLNDFINRAKIKHGETYNYSTSIYINKKIKLEIICNEHGSFWQSPQVHYKSGCHLCATDRSKIQNFEERARIVHGNLYDYSKVNYINAKTKVIITCKVHNKEFLQIADDHLAGHGCCKKCSYDSASARDYDKELIKFINTSNKVHNYKYNYSETFYKDSLTKVKIICNEHGPFWQLPSMHTTAIQGCMDCGGSKKLTTAIFVERCNLLYNYKYDYSKSVYLDRHQKIEIICPTHKSFWQAAGDHMEGHECSKCYSGTSKQEIAWLDYMKIPDTEENRNVYIKLNNRKIRADGYYNGVVYEYNGDFWHGNPKKYNPEDINHMTKTSYKELYEATLNKEKAIIEAGYKLISIWESDWKILLKQLLFKEEIALEDLDL